VFCALVVTAKRSVDELLSQSVVGFWGQRHPNPHGGSIPGPAGVLSSPDS